MIRRFKKAGASYSVSRNFCDPGRIMNLECGAVKPRLIFKEKEESFPGLPSLKRFFMLTLTQKNLIRRYLFSPEKTQAGFFPFLHTFSPADIAGEYDQSREPYEDRREEREHRPKVEANHCGSIV